MKTLKKIVTVLLWILFPLIMLYLLALRCGKKRRWPDGMKEVRYAHRGLHYKPDHPENSLAAFREAIAHGYGAELDVHLMKDGKLAVIHDASLSRTAGADVEIEDLTAADLENYRLEGTEEKIPLFEEVLELFSDQTPLVVELKAERGNHDELAKAAAELIDRYPVRYCMESFDPRCLIWLKNNRPDIIRGQLSGDLLNSESTTPKPVLWALSQLLENFLTTPDFIAYDERHRSKVPGLALARLLYGVQEVSWTVRSEARAEELEKQGCLIIFENFGC